MSAVNYYLRFGSTAPSNFSGLSPTFISFRNQAGGATTSPAISEISTTGLYTFAYDTQGSVNFIVDGATTGLGSSDRYIAGGLDVIDKSDQLFAYGTTMTAIGNTLVAFGTTNVALGTTNVALGTANLAIGTTLAAIGTTLSAIGLTNAAIGQTTIALLGSSASLIGDNSSSPTTVFGFIMRARQWLEGDSTYTKATGVLQNYDRSGATLISQVTIADNGTTVTRT